MEIPEATQEEIVLNLWYVRDAEGVIYSLRARAYVCQGTDEEKLEFLRSRATLDYLVAQHFTIPDDFNTQVGIGDSHQIMPVWHVSALTSLDSPIALFESAIAELQDGLPAQTTLEIPQDPLVCTTHLIGSDDGNIVPRIDGIEHY